MGKDQAGDFLRKAEEADMNVKWASDPRVRQRWKEVAGAYRMLAAAARIKAMNSSVLSYRLTA